MSTRRPQVGDLVGGRYSIERALAEGGMGAVYVARHTTTSATVALKVLRDPSSQPEIVKTHFVREARVAAALGHPGIVRVLDAGDDPVFGPFLVMELLSGLSLDQHIAANHPPVLERLSIVREMLEALAVAHEAGIVHRDIKPENVFLADDGEGGVRVKLLDFGIAREHSASTQTTDGTALGTIYYMSPEQMTDARNASFAADVWSVGVMLFELCSDELPFEGSSIHEVAVRVCTQPPKPLPPLDPAIDPVVRPVIAQCLERDPAHRPTNARALASLLDECGIARQRPSRVAPSAGTTNGPHASADAKAIGVTATVEARLEARSTHPHIISTPSEKPGSSAPSSRRTRAATALFALAVVAVGTVGAIQRAARSSRVEATASGPVTPPVTAPARVERSSASEPSLVTPVTPVAQQPPPAIEPRTAPSLRAREAPPRPALSPRARTNAVLRAAEPTATAAPVIVATAAPSSTEQPALQQDTPTIPAQSPRAQEPARAPAVAEAPRPSALRPQPRPTQTEPEVEVPLSF
jgi:serine/threonine-protein kinase